MTLADKIIVAAMAFAAVALAAFGWWLSRPPKVKRGGFVADRWKR